MSRQLAGLSIALAGLFGTASLAGCTIPDFPDEGFISVGEVVDRVQCELRHAKASYGKEVDAWQGAFALKLSVITNQEANPSLDWVIPYRLNETFKFSPSLAISNRVTREGKLKFDIVFRDLSPTPCNNVQNPGLHRLYGDFGLANWIGRTLGATGPDDRTSPGAFDYSLEFGIKLGGRATPGFSIIRLGGSAALSADRTDSHSLTATFTKAPSLSPLLSANIVCVANLPNAGRCDQAAILRIVQQQRERGAEFRGLKQQLDTGPRPRGLDPQTRELLYQRLDLLDLRNTLQR